MTSIHPCMNGCLLEDSTITVPFDPTDSTEEHLAKENHDIWNNVMATELHYELGQNDGNWYDVFDK